ncbi:MAG: hypothetical protein DMF06_05445 [Verrucomicrobia bacterium]|nr:MAG: hypothetical protein DMF06_05445 [Verrucomicrobiota bacterium]
MEKNIPEAIRPDPVSKFMRIFSVICLLSLGIPNAFADPAAELASFSVFDKVDLAALANSPSVAHGVPMSGSYISAQSCFVVAAPAARVAEALRQWNPARHSDLKVLLHSDLPSSPGPANFSRLSSAPNNGAVQSLVSATLKGSTDLQISNEEAKKLPTSGGSMAGPVANFWAGVLSGRARAFSSGGTRSQPPYDHTGKAVRPAEEFSGLMQQQDKIRKQFSGLIDGSGNGRGGGEPFWELLTADEQGVLTLGASYRRSGPNGGSQAADVLYYASGGYYVGLTLYQMWPVDIGGKPSTLVWRGDFISAAAIVGLHGIERVASESSMMRDISKAVSAFRRDIGGGR